MIRSPLLPPFLSDCFYFLFPSDSRYSCMPPPKRFPLFCPTSRLTSRGSSLRFFYSLRISSCFPSFCLPPCPSLFSLRRERYLSWDTLFWHAFFLTYCFFRTGVTTGPLVLDQFFGDFICSFPPFFPFPWLLLNIVVPLSPFDEPCFYFYNVCI